MGGRLLRPMVLFWITGQGNTATKDSLQPSQQSVCFWTQSGSHGNGDSMAAAGGQAPPSFLTSKQKRERDQKWNVPILAYSCSLSAPVALLGLFCHTKSVARPDQRIRIGVSYYFLRGGGCVCARRHASPAPVCSAWSLPILNLT